MLLVRGLVAQQIPVRTRIVEPLIALSTSLTERECNGTVGISRLYLSDDSAHPLIIEIRVLSALQNERPKAKRIPFVTAREYLVGRQSIALTLSVTAAYSAIATVVFAYITYLDKPTDKHLVAIMPLAHSNRALTHKLDNLMVSVINEKFIFLKGK
jgi:hypothetical protein